MAKKIPFTIAGIDFPTKKAAQEYIRSIVARYADDERVKPEDEGFVLELLAMHPDYEHKRGVGVSHFTVGPDEFGKNRCFYLYRIDGKRTDFSAPKCLNGKNVRHDVLTAMRRAVADQIIAFRNQELDKTPPPRCPFHDVVLTHENYHVDHAKPATFASIADQWFKQVGGFAAVKISEPKDMQWAAEMTCPEQTSQWQEHHRRLANLRLTSKAANLSDAKKAAKGTDASTNN